MGRRVLRYRPELLLNVDPSEACGERIETCSETDLRDVVLAQVMDPNNLEPGEDDAWARQIFAPINRDLLAEIFSTTTSARGR